MVGNYPTLPAIAVKPMIHFENGYANDVEGRLGLFCTCATIVPNGQDLNPKTLKNNGKVHT